MSLFNELKRRNVIRVSMVYLAGAWLFVQVADTLIPWLGLDDSVGRVLLIVLIVGFVPTVVAAWVLEWTPEGIRFDDEVEVDAAGAVVARRRLDRIIIGILAIAVVYFAVDEFLFDAGQTHTANGSRSIAVLPFEDISRDGDQAYLGNGIADELRLELQHLEGLRVAGRTSSNAYAEEDSKSIGELLNVESILEGSVRKEGDSVRITVQLTDTADGFTIWSESYNRKLTRIFEMQEEIATSVAGALGVRLGVGSANAFHGAGTQSVEAYETYLRAQAENFTSTAQENAVPLLERAIELDPNYAVAYSMLAIRVLTEMWDASTDEMPQLENRAIELALRGVQLDPESAAAHSALGVVRMMQFDWIGGEQAHRRAMELLADRPTAVRYAILLMRSGRMTAAQEQFHIAESLEPMGGRPAGLSWHASLAQGQIEEAREKRHWDPGEDLFEDDLDLAFNEQDPEALKTAIRALPETNLSNIHLYGPLLALFDSPDRVLSILRDVYHDKSVHWPRKLHDIAMSAVYFGDPQFALAIKREEILINPSRIAAIWYPVMSDVRKLPEFRDFAIELNLVEYWRIYGWAEACRPLGVEEFECS